jgi:hypothetical protein
VTSSWMRVGDEVLPVQWSPPVPLGGVGYDGSPAWRSVQQRARAAASGTPALDELREWLEGRKSARPWRVGIG